MYYIHIYVYIIFYIYAHICMLFSAGMFNQLSENECT